MDVGTDKAPVKEGDVVAGKYRVEKQIGSGGMGIVFAARHLQLDEPVALKFVAVDRAADREAVGRMMREARATFRLRSEHTVRVLDVGELPSGLVFLVMELLEGRDLRSELIARGPLPEQEVVQHALGVCAALEEAHAAGIVHRDLKPHNLFLARTPRGTTVLKVLDFGMVKVDRELFEEGPLTRPETALGTPRYMAPEQWKSAASVDHRADIWALGVVMFELLTGDAPLVKLRPIDRHARLVAGAIPSPRELRPEVSEGVSRAVMKCLRPDVEVRWPSVAHLASALRSAHPELAPSAQHLEVTRTGVTVALPPEEIKRRAAVAFASPNQAQVAPPTARESPLARNPLPPVPPVPPVPPPRAEDFDAKTEVRPPAFTPAEMLAASVRPASPTSIKPTPAKFHPATLRSAGVTPDLAAALAPTMAHDKTLLLQQAPLFAAPPVAPGPQSPWRMVWSRLALLPRAARLLVPVQLDARGIALVVVGGLVSMLVTAALAWIVVRAFSD